MAACSVKASVDVLESDFQLAEAGIQTGIHYPVPLHLQPALADLGQGPGRLPAAEAAAAEVLSLPMYPELPPEAPGRVAEAFRAILRG